MSDENYTGQFPQDKTGDPLIRSFFKQSGFDQDTSTGVEIEGFAPPEDTAGYGVYPNFDELELDELDDDIYLTSTPVKSNTQIRDLGDEEYRLNEPLLITIEEYPFEGEVIARFPELELFADGVTESEAIAALKLEILDLYDELTEESVENLGKKPLAWLRILNNLVSRGPISE